MPLALRFALRELRGGIRGFAVFLACIVLGVAAIAGVGSVAGNMSAGLAREGCAILGGDLAVTILQRPANPAEKQYLAAIGTLSETVTMRAMARPASGDSQALVELKAVDGAYPLVGALAVEGGGDPAALLASRGGIAGALADPELLTRLGLSVGDRLRLGFTELELRGVIADEPDRLSGGFAVGPRLLISADALTATGLVQPGSLASWTYRLSLAGPPGDAAVTALSESIEKAFPEAAWRVRARDDAAPGLRDNIRRFAEFLTLIGLTALIVGGVGIANAVSGFLDTKRDVIATFRCLGAPAAFAVRVYFIEILLIAAAGIVAGLVLGAMAPPVAGRFLERFVPVPISGIEPGELLVAAVYGVLTVVVFALYPLGRAAEVSPTTLFRGQVEPSPGRPGTSYLIALVLAAVALAGLAIGLAFDRRVAMIFVAGSVGAFVLLRVVAAGIAALAWRLRQHGPVALRIAVGNIHRPGALTGSIVLSLGLGLTLMIALVLIDGNFRRDLFGSIPKDAPSFFFLDIQGSEADGLRAFVAERAPDARLELQPMLRGRITELAGVAADKAEIDDGARWVLRGDRGITYAATRPENNRLAEGEWWPADYSGEPLVSFEEEAGRGLRLKLGDSVTVNVLGREITAKVANFRTLDWRSLSINSVMIFSPNTFRGAPFTSLATLAWPQGSTAEAELAFLKDVVPAFPAITVVRVKDAIATANGILEQVGWATRAASGVTLLAAMLVLAGAFAAGRRQRVHDAVILKTLGATRGRLVAAFTLEFLLLGVATSAFGILAGSVAAWFVLNRVMDVSFAFLPGAALSVAAVALVVTLVFGLAGTWRVLGLKVAPVLRNL